MGNTGMKLNRFSEKEKAVLRSFVDDHRAAKCYTSDDYVRLTVMLSEVNGGIERKRNTIWDGLKRFGEMANPVRGSQSSVSERATKKIAGSEAAAKKVLEELSPIIKFMGKLPEYLKPLELLLSEHQVLAERLLVAEGKIAATKEAKKTSKTSIAAAKASARKTKEMAKELKTLRNFLKPAKIILRETCDLRVQAAALTKRVEEMKKRNGTNLFEFLKELEDCESLRE